MNAYLFADPLVRRGAAAAAVVVAFGLLAGFHTVVAGAVDRAAEKRLALATQPDDLAARTTRNAVALQSLPNTAFTGAAYAPRTVSYRSAR